MLRRKPRCHSASWTRCALRIANEGLTPDEVSARLGLDRDGGSVLRDEIADLSFTHDTFVSSWFTCARVDHFAPASAHLEELLARIEPRRCELAELIAGGALVELMLAILADEFACPFELPPDLAGQLARLNVPLRVHFTPEAEWTRMLSHVDGHQASPDGPDPAPSG